MNDAEFENLIRQNLRTDRVPSREVFGRMISKLETQTVTVDDRVRYNQKTTPSYIISTFIHNFRSIRLVLAPSLILVLSIAGFSLHARDVHSSTVVIEQLASANERTEETGIDLDEGILTSFDTKALDELTTN